MARVAYVICGDADDHARRRPVRVGDRVAADAGRCAIRRHVRAWLVAIAANEARQAVRRRRRDRVVDISEDLDRPVGNDHGGSSAEVVDLRPRAARPDRPRSEASSRAALREVARNRRSSISTRSRSRLRAGQVRIGVRPSVSEELPRVADLGDLVQVEVADDQLLVVAEPMSPTNCPRGSTK